MPCDLTVREAGKSTVTHNCKQLSLSLAAIAGVDYNNVQWVASHKRDTTRNHYLLLCYDALHRSVGRGCGKRCQCGSDECLKNQCRDLLWYGGARLAGSGLNWGAQHLLGRAISVPAEFLEVAIPGLTALIQQVRTAHSQHPILASLEALDWMRHVWLQVCVLRKRAQCLPSRRP